MREAYFVFRILCSGLSYSGLAGIAPFLIPNPKPRTPYLNHA